MSGLHGPEDGSPHTWRPHRLNWAPLRPKRRRLEHSVRVGDPQEGNSSSSIRENRLELLGSVCWSPSPPSLAPPQTLTSPPVSLSPLACFCLSLFMALSISLCVLVSLSRALLPSPPPNPLSWRQVHCFSEPRLCAASTGSSAGPDLIMQSPTASPRSPRLDGLAGELARFLPVPPRQTWTGCRR